MTKAGNTLHGIRYCPEAHRTSSKEVTRAEMGVSVSMRGLQQISSSVIRPDQKLETLLRMAHAVESAIMDIHFHVGGDFDDKSKHVNTVYPVIDAERIRDCFPEDSPFYTHRERLAEMRDRHTDFGNSLKEHTDD